MRGTIAEEIGMDIPNIEKENEEINKEIRYEVEKTFQTQYSASNLNRM